MSRIWKPGEKASVSTKITQRLIRRFASVSGDNNPVHLDSEYAKKSRFGRRIAHGMLSGSFVSAVLGTQLPGEGAIYKSQSFRFLRPVYPGNTITTTVTVDSYDEQSGNMVLTTECANELGQVVLTGTAEVKYRSAA